MTDKLTIKAAPETNIFESPLFPFDIYIGGCKITLQADGSYDGDVGQLEFEMRNAKGIDSVSAALLWLILREMKRDDQA